MDVSYRAMRALRAACLRFGRDRRGAMAVTLGLLMTSFAGMVALSVDVTDWYSTRRAMQSAADAAALGGAYALYNGGSNSQATAAATTDAPAPASISAIALPIPAPAPVTTAT